MQPSWTIDQAGAEISITHNIAIMYDFEGKGNKVLYILQHNPD